MDSDSRHRLTCIMIIERLCVCVLHAVVCYCNALIRYVWQSYVSDIHYVSENVSFYDAITWININ